MQYIKLVNNIGSTNMPTVTTAKTKIPPLVPTMTKIDKDTPIIVASSNFTTTNLSLKNASTVQTSSTSGTTGITVVPMITNVVSSTSFFMFLLFIIVMLGFKSVYFCLNFTETSSWPKATVTGGL